MTDVGGRFDGQSIAVTRPVRRVPTDSEDWNRLIGTLEGDAQFSGNFQCADTIEDVCGFQFEPDGVRGLAVKES